MPCGGCSKRANRKYKPTGDPVMDLMGGFANLNNQQIKARLEAYKRQHCSDCKERYTCDLAKYKRCKSIK